MKHLLLIPIKIYWKIIHQDNRRKCLFQKTCSNYVFEKTTNEGLFAGLKALIFRMHNCNPHFNVISIDGEKKLISSSNKVFEETDINSEIFKNYD